MVVPSWFCKVYRCVMPTAHHSIITTFGGKTILAFRRIVLLYQLMWAANLQLETLFSDQKPHIQAPQPLLEPFILLLRLEGKCSIPSMSSILKYFQYQPNSVGYLSECFQHYGAALPSTLSMAKHTVVFY